MRVIRADVDKTINTAAIAAGPDSLDIDLPTDEQIASGEYQFPELRDALHDFVQIALPIIAKQTGLGDSLVGVDLQKLICALILTDVTNAKRDPRTIIKRLK